MPRVGISLTEARRTALAAQGFVRTRPKGGGDIRHVRRAIRQIGLLQLDFVNVLIPAHYLVLYSRLGAYRRRQLHDLVYRRREFVEQWAHEASIVPMEAWPLLEHRRNEYRPYPGSPIMKIRGKGPYLDEVLKIVEQRGPVTTADLPPFEGPERKPGDWHRSIPRWALECHFGAGRVAVTDRLPNFQRVYDLPERVIAGNYLRRSVAREDAQRGLLSRAAKACGVATMRDLADYYRMSPKDAAARIPELVEEGVLREIGVESWDEPGLLHRDAVIPRSVRTSTLLSPFDPVIWFRPRAERLFGFHYRIEIYVPAGKRKWGYYVLPFLLDDRIVARVDLKADRRNRRLLVLAAHAEQGIDRGRTARELATELASLADWLDLDSVRASRKGSFARELAACITS
jgi:uncharacterized protein YcaQ